MNFVKKSVDKLSALFAASVIISFVSRLSAVIYRKLREGFFGRIFTAYDREEEAVQSSYIAHLCRKVTAEKKTRPVKTAIARGIEESFFLAWIRNLTGRLLGCQVRTYGLFFLSSAIYSALVYLFKFFFIGKAEDDLDIGLIVTLVFLIIAAVAMMSTRISISVALRESKISSFFLYRIVGIRRETLENVDEQEGKLNIAFILGVVFGLLSYFVQPLWILIALLAMIFAYVILVHPEFGVWAILTLLPFLPTMLLVGMVLYTSLCYFLKLICGKRSLRFDLLDGMVLLFMGLMFFGGVVALSSGSIKPMLVYVAFMLGYFLVVNLIRSSEWLKRCLYGLAVSCTAVAAYGIYQNFFGMAAATWQDQDMFSSIEGRVVSTFENPNVLAEYLIMVMPLILAITILLKVKKEKIISAVCFAVTGGCLIYTWSRGAWLGFLIGMVIFLMMISKKALTVMMCGICAVPVLPFILPSSITSRFLSIGNLGDSSTSYRVYIWQGVTKMLQECFVSGIGIGNDSFRLIYPRYALSAIESAPHSHNLYLQILVEIGIVGLLIFLALTVIWAQSCVTFHVTEEKKTKLLSDAVFCGMVAVLAQGLTDYIWYNYRVFLMFWLMLGLSAAIRRIHAANASESLF